MQIYEKSEIGASKSPTDCSVRLWVGVGSFNIPFVDIDAADVVEAVGELFEDEKMSAAAVKSEDV